MRALSGYCIAVAGVVAISLSIPSIANASVCFAPAAMALMLVVSDVTCCGVS